jgi:hypothetical protein
VYYIWDWSTTSTFRPGEDSFEHLSFLHLDYCPRLVHVLPLYTENTNGCRSLETLEMVCCGDLREVFPSDSKSQQQEELREFPSLKRIHLYELPKLQTQDVGAQSRDCQDQGMLGPQAPTSRWTSPVVDCEKDWWDGLEWDEESASHYETSYSSEEAAPSLRAQVTNSSIHHTVQQLSCPSYTSLACLIRSNCFA